MRTQREQLLGAVTSSATKAITGRVLAKCGTRAVTRMGHPGLLAGDAVELGSRILCDSCGVEDRTAETVSSAAGAGTTVVAGALIGAVAGPGGAVVGAGAGLGFWVVGRVAGEAVACVLRKATHRPATTKSKRDSRSTK